MTRAAAIAYTPMPGSVAARAIAHLEMLPAHTEVSSSALAEAIDVKANALVACLAAARARGALRSRRREGTLLLFWSLGDGVPLPRPPEDDDLPSGAPPAKPGTVPASVFQLAPKDQLDRMSEVARRRAEDPADESFLVGGFAPAAKLDSDPRVSRITLTVEVANLHQAERVLQLVREMAA